LERERSEEGETKTRAAVYCTESRDGRKEKKVDRKRVGMVFYRFSRSRNEE
jgi:hypothetical protein